MGGRDGIEGPLGSLSTLGRSGEPSPAAGLNLSRMKSLAAFVVGVLGVWGVVVLDRATGASTKFLSMINVGPK